ncbi:hypothetical protein K2P56_00110 [Patescibacteria group bacterium]|nr:hypothetical protein [Patescibacteria group bacterium]
MSEAPASLFRMAWVKILLALVVAVILGVIAYYGYQYSLRSNLSEKLPETGSTVMFSDQGIAERFAMTQFSFTQIPPERVGDTVILESKPSPTVTGEEIVLMQKDGVPGIMLGTKNKSEISVLLDDGTNKSDLLVTPEGIAVFAVSARPALLPEDPKPEDTSLPVDTSESEVEEVGSADGPVVLSAFVAPPVTSAGGLFAFNLQSKKTVPLGAGKSPRLSELGGVLAVSPEGVVEVNPFTGERVIVVQYRGGDAAGSALSNDGSIAALRRDNSSTVEFFRISGMRGVYLGQIFSSSPMYGTAILGEEHIFVRTGKDTVALYALSDDPSAVQPNFAQLGLLLPN